MKVKGIEMDENRLKELINEAVENNRVQLYHYQWIDNGVKAILRVFIDKEYGVSIKDCEMVSRQLSILLDAENLISHKYTLEVSSPGMDRQLFNVDHYKANMHKLVVVKLKKVDSFGRRKWKGKLISVDEDTFMIETKEGEKKSFSYEDVENTRLLIKF